MGTRKEMNMSRKLIIDGNAVYEIDEQCMLKRKLESEEKMTKEEGKKKEGMKEKENEK
jgi:hypothetical protein